MVAPALLDDEHVAFLRGPVSAFLATADPAGAPDATRANAVARVGESRLRVLISADAHVALRNAVPGAPAAVLVTDITTYRSLQWKGHVVGPPSPRTLGDLVLVDAAIDAFRSSCTVVGISPDRAHRLYAAEVVAVEVDVDVLFDQTPGPGAGARVVG